MSCRATDLIKSVYIEGSGTFKKKDRKFGLGLAMADSGLHSRVSHGFQKIMKVREKSRPTKIYLNIFGLSHAPFYHFIHNSLDTTKIENSSDNRNHGPHRILINDNV